jgi:hypothetical protein
MILLELRGARIDTDLDGHTFCRYRGMTTWPNSHFLINISLFEVPSLTVYKDRLSIENLFQWQQGTRGTGEGRRPQVKYFIFKILGPEIALCFSDSSDEQVFCLGKCDESIEALGKPNDLYRLV